MDLINRQWVLASRPQSTPSREHFLLREERLNADDLSPGEVVVKNIYALCAPSQRNWMRERADHHPSIALGGVVAGPVASQVIRSADPSYPVGRFGFGLSGWQDYARLNPGKGDVLELYPEGVTPLQGLSIFGINTAAAYIGITEYGRIRPGETMLVSGAAGSAGSAAAQIGKIMGCRVAGLAGTDEKCRWLLDSCGLDVAINYRTSDLAGQLVSHFPNGIDIFFDNVGGRVLATVLHHMAKGGRILLNGQIASYNDSQLILSSDHLTRMVYRTISMHGFNLNHFLPRVEAAVADLRRWVDEGLLKHREDVRDGLDKLPDVYAELFEGTNSGTLIVRIGAPEPVAPG